MHFPNSKQLDAAGTGSVWTTVMCSTVLVNVKQPPRPRHRALRRRRGNSVEKCGTHDHDHVSNFLSRGNSYNHSSCCMRSTARRGLRLQRARPRSAACKCRSCCLRLLRSHGHQREGQALRRDVSRETLKRRSVSWFASQGVAMYRMVATIL